jgi:hypothetical protein
MNLVRHDWGEMRRGSHGAFEHTQLRGRQLGRGASRLRAGSLQLVEPRSPPHKL